VAIPLPWKYWNRIDPVSAERSVVDTRKTERLPAMSQYSVPGEAVGSAMGEIGKEGDWKDGWAEGFTKITNAMPVYFVSHLGEVFVWQD